MATPKKKPNPAGLIAIANPALAQKLEKSSEKEKRRSEKPNDANLTPAKHTTFNQDKWKAVVALNVLRYGLALALLTLIAFKNSALSSKLLSTITHFQLFQVSSIVLLSSAVCFTVFTKTKKFPLSIILITQFLIDVFLCGAFVHASGSVQSNFVILFIIVVATGSVVLKRKDAIALASGATIMLFYEHFYSLLQEEGSVEAQFDTLALYCILLLVAGFSISYLAQRLRAAEMQSFKPGNESIEEYLVREEKAALNSALQETDGNKTEAAKLLGMTFRSFRYKLTKYDIG